MKRILVVALLGLVACASAKEPIGVHGTGTLTGRATLGPTCPGPQRQNEVCTKPYAGKFVAVAQSGARTKFTSDDSGAFSVALEPGAYSIELDGSPGPFPVLKPVSVQITQGATTTQNLDLDTGIR